MGAPWEGTKFHPKMYPTSIRKGECFNESCRPKHVIGTKRIPREQPDSETESPETPSNTQANSDFLEALRLLKADHTPPQSLYPVKAPQHKVMYPNNIGSLQQHGSRSIHYKSTALDKPYSTHDAQHDVQHPVAASNATAIQPSGDLVHPRTHDVRTGEHGTCSRDTADANIHGSSTHSPRTDPLNYCSTWNIQGLRPRTGPSKVPYVRDLLHDHNQMSMVLTETWLREHKDAELQIDGYSLFRQDRQRNRRWRGKDSRGVASYIRSDLSADAEPLLNYSNGVIDALGIYSKFNKLLIITVYRQPNDNMGGNRSTAVEFR